MFIDKVPHTLQAGQLESVGISEGKALHSACSVVSCFRIFYLVVEKNDLRAGPAENFVDRSDLAEYGVGFRVHVE